MSHSKLLQWGLLVLILADIVLALSGHWSTLLIGVALWGIHMGMTRGLLAAMVAHTAPPELRGTAFGMFNLMSGWLCCWPAPARGYCGKPSAPPRRFTLGR